MKSKYPIHFSVALSLFILIILSRSQGVCQPLPQASFTSSGEMHLTIPDGKTSLQPVFFSLLIDDSLHYSSEALFRLLRPDSATWSFNNGLHAMAGIFPASDSGSRICVRFINRSERKIRIENVVPFGESDPVRASEPDRIVITARGTKDWPAYLCRSVLLRPGYAPVGVVLPDNAWHMGFCNLKIDDAFSVVAICRRGKRDNTGIDRWAATISPAGWVEYNFYFDVHRGTWQQGLEIMFRERYLYDLKSFDDKLFRRTDLAWMRKSYLMLLRFAWDHKYVELSSGKISFYDHFNEYDQLVGGWDIFTLWPTWPRLGLDRRNQWDMYRDLPGGLPELRKQADYLHRQSKKLFISYNPWDESTRKEEQLSGMEDILRATDADGVVLDTRGASSYELQAAADKVKPGIIMYSEGMAIPKDMPGIVAGRVHDALYMPPPLNLNKFMRPDFAIFRVSQLADGPIHRESSVAFFNGCGTEMNVMRPGRPQWIEEEFRYLGMTSRILRENSSVFLDMHWTPLVATLADSIWVNEWTSKEKRLYTVFSLIPGGYKDGLFEIEPGSPGSEGRKHWVSLWNHEELRLDTMKKDGKEILMIPCDVASFDRAYIGTRKEGNVDCIAELPVVLDIGCKHGIIDYKASRGEKICIWAGNPAYDKKPATFTALSGSIPLHDYFGRTEEKFVVQVFAGSELLDERVVMVPLATPRLISTMERTRPAKICPEGMVLIPEGSYLYKVRRDTASQEAVIPFPANEPETIVMSSFYMDKYPVTNGDFKIFLKAGGYQPKDTANFLRHWLNAGPVPGTEKEPVVYINLEDAKAYAAWAGKRLPLEKEWQWAGQGSDGRRYPWGNKIDNRRCNNKLNHPTPVNRFPKGASPFGVMDLTGNVWQMTNDIYDNGSYYFNIIRGGSYYKPEGSIWYVTGGPVPVDHPEMLLMVGPGMDRCSTVGFRCVKDR